MRTVTLDHDAVWAQPFQIQVRRNTPRRAGAYGDDRTTTAVFRRNDAERRPRHFLQEAGQFLGCVLLWGGMVTGQRDNVGGTALVRQREPCRRLRRPCIRAPRQCSERASHRHDRRKPHEAPPPAWAQTLHHPR
jgi:hypothetical protein